MNGWRLILNNGAKWESSTNGVGKLSVMTKSKDALHKAHQKRTARDIEYQKTVDWCKREKKRAKACMTQNKQCQHILVESESFFEV